MIIYDTKNWGATLLKLYLSFNKAFTTRVLFKYIFYISIYTTAVVTFDLLVLPTPIKVEPLFFSLLGVILSLMLVFRLNTSYSKWWEGRVAWGTLVNHSRVLAAQLHAILPKEAQTERKYFAAQIANFAYMLQSHLRGAKNWHEIEPLGKDYLASLQKSKNVPYAIATQILQRIEEHIKNNTLHPMDKQPLFHQVETMINVMGMCERIKNTPIPFSHSSYIKTFILIYILTLPFGLVSTLVYYTIPTVALIAYALVGVEVVSEEVEEPFGTEANDLPLLQLSKVIKNSVFEALNCSYEIEITDVEINTKFIQIVR
jgi:putative membrane protein